MKRSWLVVVPLVAVIVAGCERGSDASDTTGPVTTVSASVAPPTAPTSDGTEPIATPPASGQPTDTTPTPSTGDPVLPTAICAERLQEAVGAGDAENVEAFYPALADCTGLADWVAAVTATNALDGQDPVTFASRVCGVDGPMTSVTCQEAMAAAPVAVEE